MGGKAILILVITFSSMFTINQFNSKNTAEWLDSKKTRETVLCLHNK